MILATCQHPLLANALAEIRLLDTMTKKSKKNGSRSGADPDLPEFLNSESRFTLYITQPGSHSSIKKSNSVSSNSSGDFFTSDDKIKTIDTSSDSEASMNTDIGPKTNQTQLSQQKENRIPLPPPITIPSGIWLNAAPLTFKNPNIRSEGLTAKASAEGKILLKTVHSSQFRQFQKCLLDNSIEFHTYSLPVERLLKVILRGIPTKIPIEVVQSELEQLNFDIKIIRRFGTADKPMPFCLVILSGVNAKEIYQQT